MRQRQCSGSIIGLSSAGSKNQCFIKHGRKVRPSAQLLCVSCNGSTRRGQTDWVAMTIHMSKHWLREHDKALHLSLTVEQVDEMIAGLEQEKARQFGSNGGEQKR